MSTITIGDYYIHYTYEPESGDGWHDERLPANVCIESVEDERGIDVLSELSEDELERLEEMIMDSELGAKYDAMIDDYELDRRTWYE